MRRLDPLSITQRNREVWIEVDHEGPPGSAQLVICADDVPALLRVALEALIASTRKESK